MSTRGSLCTPSESGSHRHFIDLAHAANARVAFFTAHPDASVAAKANVLVVLPIESVVDGARTQAQPMGTLFEQALLLVLDALILRLMVDLDVSEEAMERLHTSLE